MTARIRTGLAKVVLAAALVFSGSLLGNLTLANQSAVANCGSGTVDAGSFFFLRPWYAGLTQGVGGSLCRPVMTDGAVTASDEIALSTFIWRLAFNIADIILGIIAYAAVFFVLYGGFNIVFSGGDTGKVAKGKTTIANALVGVAIALSASGIVRFVNDTLLGSGGSIQFDPATGQPLPGAGGADTQAVWVSATEGIMRLAVIVAVMMVAWGGVKYSTSAGDPQAMAKAKNTIVFALIGAVVMLFASFAVGLIFTAVTGQDPTFN
ncbi:pilin [Candidatus Saccharibacteria bacterium]|nr:pilin [Candidatus Saccharibacteria bacterium]